MVAQMMSRVPGRNIIIQRGELEEQIVDGIQGLADITAFGRGSDRAAQISSAGNKLANMQRRLAQISGFQSGLYAFVTGFVVWLLLIYLIPQVASGYLNGLLLASFVLLSQASFEALLPLPLAAQIWSSTRQALLRLFEILDAKPLVVDTEESETNSQLPLIPETLKGDHKIQLEDLSFTYPGSNSPALQHITFTLETCRSIALVGPSGAGKSTLASLLERFWDYSSGEIRLNGTPLRNYKQEEVRQRIALISQHSYFFNTTIYENLRMARRGVTQEEIESATVQAQIYDFIKSLPKSFETVIGEQGQRLSTGERQRLAIARAIIKNAPILILDEPTANLDAMTENKVLATLFEMMKHKTTILITHRLLGLEKMDEILVMDHGCIVDRGSERELLAHNGLYRRLFDLQNRMFIET
jgi:ATP-binding cassette subfamily C protein CydC